ncbi:hypothetical protein NCS57_01178700 [Fusarium keratoplasticum]|uniref:Uncharacterized protein n=1 Tax=Fusarium keratoplasticum TaxID=1328300 RepID=A0ACC0QPQ3_9HYPO|nr:hypothetical protein NCS57_01178700 [Fusarium keratoplasticum]KAI8657985.1 hypothetical protein NCS57_01178700 [Fusarium keratoplasticum]
MAIEPKGRPHARSSRLSLTNAGEESVSSPHKPKFKSGWKFGLFAGAASCTVVFVINLFATIWAVTRDEKNELGQPVLQQGRCSDMRYLNTGLHLVINALSSVLLAASNYGMQCMSAPTRADVDRVHFEGKWLDIGVPSVHNLRHFPKKRVAIWGLLVLSSLPLHLIYNSVVFSSLVTVGYDIWEMQAPHYYNLSQSEIFARFENASGIYPKHQQSWVNLTKLGTSNRLEKLSNSECIRQYATSFQTSHQSLILVTGAEEPELNDQITWLSRVVINTDYIETSYNWMCGSGNCPFQDIDTVSGVCRDKLPALEQEADNWSPWCDKVEYCYSQPIDETCQVTFNPTFIAFVLVSNALKAMILLYIALRPPEESLFVLGDAVESFLIVPDAFSGGSCLATADDIRKNGGDWIRPRTWTPVNRRWAAAISRRRWKISIILYSSSLSVALFFLIFGIVRLPSSKDFGAIWRLGFGAVTEVTLIWTRDRQVTNSFTMTQGVLLANLPHFVFSGLYFQYNAIFTGMLAANEWSDFGRKRKGLRVSSNPEGWQRSRYFLQLPYRWSIPLIFMSILIHWLLSQSVFIVPLQFESAREDHFATTLGYSPIAIIAVTVAAAAMALAVIISGYRRLPTAMPVVGSCSLGIAAACHGLGGAERTDETVVPLRWGAMTHPEEGSAFDESGHCGFSGDYVDEPRVGAKYA